MKKRRKKVAAKKLADAVAVDFTRGFVATGLLSAFQDRDRSKNVAVDAGRNLRRAVQGGIAMAAACAAADALRRRDYATVVTAATAGTAALMAIEKFPRRPALINSGDRA